MENNVMNLNPSTIESAAVFMMGSADKSEALEQVLMETGLPFPVFNELVILAQGKKKTISHPYIDFLIDEACTFYICGYSNGKLVDKDKEFKDSKLRELEAIIEEYTDAQSVIPMVGSKDINNYLYKNVSQWMHSLTEEQIGKFVQAFAKKPEYVEVYSSNGLIIKIKAANGNGSIFNFTKKTIQARQEHELRKFIGINGQTYDSNALMLYLCINTIRTPKSINEVLSNLPNALNRKPGYGVQGLDEFDQTKDVAATLMNGGVLGISFPRQGKMFPWASLTSVKLQTETIDEMAKDGTAYITDKYYMKDIGGESPANAAGVGRNNEYEVVVDGERYVVDVVLNNNRSDKLPKLLNGPNQFYRFLKAQVEGWKSMSWGNILPNGTIIRQGGLPLKTAIVETALNPGSGPSFIRPGLNFDVSVRKSLPKGVINFNALPKEVRDDLNEKGSSVTKQEKPGLFYLREHIEAKCKEIVEACDNGKVFKPGEVVLSYGSEFGMKEERIVVVNSNMNQDFRIVDYTITEDLSGPKQYKADYFKIKFIADLVFTDPMVKMRNAYIKLTTLPYEVKWADKNGNVIPNWGGIDIALNPETTKSPSIFMAMFIQEMGGGYYSANDGRVYLNDWTKAENFFTDDEAARYISDEEMFIDTTALIKKVVAKDGHILKLEKQKFKLNAIHNWAESKREERLMTVKVEKDYWDYASQIVDLERIHSIKEKDTHYVITEKVAVLISDYNYEVEISTPRENGGRSSLTAQQHAHIAVADPLLGDAIAKDSESMRKSAHDLVMMMKGLTHNEEPVNYKTINLNSKGRKLLKSVLGNTVYQNDRKLLKALQNRLTKDGIENWFRLEFDFNSANGSTQKIGVYVKIATLMQNIGFLSGNADGFGNIFCTVLRYAATAGNESGVESTLGSMMIALRSSLQSWMTSIVKSKSIYKRTTMTHSVMLNFKVRTSYHPALHSKDGIPVVILHPDCDVVKELLKDGNRNYHAKYLAFPYCNLSDKERCLKDEGFFRGKAYCHLDQEDKNSWTSYPVPQRLEGAITGLLRVPMVMLSAFRIKFDRNVGHVGHAIVLPHYWAFNNEGDSDGDGLSMVNLDAYGYDTQRALELNEQTLSFKGYWDMYGLNPANHPFADFCEVPGKKEITYKWTNMFWLENQYRETCKKVRGHYFGPVAVSYGVASMAVFDLINYVNGPNPKTVETGIRKLATAFAWRLMYEGLGLAGWSDGAKDFFDILRSITYAYFFNNLSVKGLEVGHDKDGKWTSKKEEIVSNKIADPIDHLIKLSGFDYQNDQMNEKQLDYVKRKVMERTIRNNLYMIGFQTITKGTNFQKYLAKNPEVMKNCVIYGALRKAIQGSDPGFLLEMGNDLGGEVQAHSLHKLVNKNKLYRFVNCEWLAKLLKRSSETLVILGESGGKLEQIQEQLSGQSQY